ncbi:MAG: GNAT family N-acetyltransferase [Clostridia bacterium]|nr:GNAT family N-acetyltransferase [Clostridia bacterium]
MIFRKTTEPDIPAVLSLYEGARETMHARGIDQWTNGYPAESDLRADMEAGYAYVLADEDDTPAATCAVLHDGEITYNEIDGKWLTDSPTGKACTYTAIHRVAADKNRRGQGLASRMIEAATELARAEGKISLRIDTHRDNIPMQRMLARNGFTHCGTITLLSGALRNAYEKLI